MLEIAKRAQPVPVIVTPILRDRVPPVGDMAGNDPLLCAVLDVTQRLTCEAARMYAACCVPANGSYRPEGHDTIGWRAHLSQETAHLVHVLEESGLAEFTLEMGDGTHL